MESGLKWQAGQAKIVVGVATLNRSCLFNSNAPFSASASACGWADVVAVVVVVVVGCGAVCGGSGGKWV
jgi:hypothetical protein